MKSVTPFSILALWLASGAALAVCDENASARTPSSRFVLSGGEAYDQQTALTWSRCAVGSTWSGDAGCTGDAKLMRLDEARQFAQEAGAGWRLPTITELHSIVEPACVNPAINSAVFPAVTDFGEGAAYWSSSHFEQMPSLVYFVDFVDGGVDAHSEGFALAVRLVRSE